MLAPVTMMKNGRFTMSMSLRTQRSRFISGWPRASARNMQQASRIADYTAFFLVGEMVEYGKTKDVFAMPKDKRTEDYITGRFG